MKCKICGKDFKSEEFFDHLVEWNKEHTGGTFPNKEHAVSREKLEAVCRNRDLPCVFCGGLVRHSSWMRSEDDCSWEIICEDCGFLYDED